MRRPVTVLFFCLFAAGAFLLVACSALTGQPSQAAATPALVTPVPVPATSAPTATPVPDPVIFLFGEEDRWFPTCCTDAAKSVYQTEIAGEWAQVAAYPGDKVLIAYGTGCGDIVNDAMNAGVPVILVTLPFDNVAGNVDIRMDLPVESGIIDAAIAFPPHDTPVRMFGLFSSKEGAAYGTWSEYTSAGKIFSKGVYEAVTSEKDLDAWLTEKLASYYPGMIDCIFAETAADALTAAEVLEREGRDDMEIFCAEYSDGLYGKMQAAPELVCGIASVDAESALSAAMEMAEGLLSGATGTEEERHIPACVLSNSVNDLS